MALKVNNTTVVDDSRNIINANSVGIGTTNPTSTLDVRGNLNVSGATTTSTLNVGTGGTIITTTSSGLVGIGTTDPRSKLQIKDTFGLETTRTTVSTTNATTIDSFSATLYRSARFQIQITQGSSYQASDILAIHDGTNASIIEYASISTGNYLANFDATISGDLLNLIILMNSATTSSVKVARYVITI